MKIFDFEQGTPEWHEIRLAKITGTRLGEIFKSNNLGLIDDLIAEEVSMMPPDNYESFAMKNGKAMEHFAREHYEIVNNVDVKQVGFCLSDKYDYLGFSPDGLLGNDNIYTHCLEIKCPTMPNHVQYIRQQQVPAIYKYQVMCSFLVNENQESHDFISYNPYFHVKPMFIHTTYRDKIEKELKETEAELLKFRAKWEDYYNKVLF